MAKMLQIKNAVFTGDLLISSLEIINVSDTSALKVGSIVAHPGLEPLTRIVSIPNYTKVIIDKPAKGTYIQANITALIDDITVRNSETLAGHKATVESIINTIVLRDTDKSINVGKINTTGNIVFKDASRSLTIEPTILGNTILTIPGKTGTLALMSDVEALEYLETISIGTITTGLPGSGVSVSLSGSDPRNPSINFTIPRGNVGPRGIAATINVDSTVTVSPETPASVTNTGTVNDASLKFYIPKGETGLTGNTGILEIIEVVTGAAGTAANVQNTGSPTHAKLKITIPQGIQGIPGEINYEALKPKVDKITTIAGLPLIKNIGTATEADNITVENLTAALNLASTTLKGLMSAEDKNRLDTLHALLEEGEVNTVVDSINEILAIFENYPEGADLVTVLEGKQSKHENLTAVSNIGAGSGFLKKSGTSWLLDNSTYIKNDHVVNAITTTDINTWNTAHTLAGYLTTETDPIFTAWNKSTGISITESQISDLKTYLTTLDATNIYVPLTRTIAGKSLTGDITAAVLLDTFSAATTTTKGLLSFEDKVKLDSVVANEHTHANKPVIDKLTETEGNLYYNDVQVGKDVPNLTLTKLTLGNYTITFNETKNSLDIEVVA